MTPILPATDSIVAPAYLGRQAAGLLTGHAAGETTTAAGPDLLADWDVRRLGVELRERGVPTVQVAAEDDTGTRVNRRGVRRDDLDKALGEGDRRPAIEE